MVTDRQNNECHRLIVPSPEEELAFVECIACEETTVMVDAQYSRANLITGGFANLDEDKRCL